jgi:hypothetical protein
MRPRLLTEAMAKTGESAFAAMLDSVARAVAS